MTWLQIAYAAGAFLWGVVIAAGFDAYRKNKALMGEMLIAKARLDEAVVLADSARAEYEAKLKMLIDAFGLPAGSNIVAIEVEGASPPPSERRH